MTPGICYQPGQRFGQLTVIERLERKNDRNSYYLCRCDCGNVKALNSRQLGRSYGATKSCGCLWKRPFGEAAKTDLLSNYRNRKQEFSLSEEEFFALVQQNCYYCGAPPSNQSRMKKGNYNGGLVCSGLDRVDNTKGYVSGNVVPCCRTCNVAKNAMTIEEFRSWIRRVYRHWADREEWHS